MDELKLNQWNELEKLFKVLANPRSLKHQDTIKFIIDNTVPAAVPPSQNEELSWSDIYELWVICITSTNQLALEDEYFEILGEDGLLNRAYMLQHNIVKSYIKNMYNGETRKNYENWLKLQDEIYQENKTTLN